jgi:hypothetical protein
MATVKKAPQPKTMSGPGRSTRRRDRRSHLEWLEARVTPSTMTWTGAGTDSKWTTLGNWAGGTTPGPGDDLVFPAGATDLSAVNDFVAGANFNSIKVDGPGYALSGAAISLAQGITTTYSSGTSNNTIDMQVRGTISVGAGGELDLVGVLTGSAGLTLAGGGKLVLGGSASNTYSGTTVDNGPTLVLSKSGGAIAVPGNLVIGDGTSPALVQARVANQIASGSIVTINDGATLDLNGNNNTIGGLSMAGGTLTTGAGTLMLGGNVTVNGPGNSDSSSISGKLDLGGMARTFTVASSLAATDLTITADIINSAAGITVAGGGTVDFSGSALSPGTTFIRGSGTTVLVDGAVGAVQVGAGATLGGGGTVGNVVSTGGTLSPGDSHGALDAGSLTLDTASTFADQLPGPATVGPGQVVASGAVALGSATLNATLASGYTPKVGDQLTIIRNTSGSSVTGRFAGLLEGSTVVISGFPFRITYQGRAGGDVVLTALPSPTTITVLASTQTSTYGGSVTFMSVVSGGLNSAPTGFIGFYDGNPAAGGKQIGLVPTKNAGSAAFATTALDVTGSPHQIYAEYFPNASSNYAGSTTTQASSVTITPATITASLAGIAAKTYDGTTAATLSSANYQLSGVKGGDVVSLNDPPAGTYDTKNVGSAKTVSVSNLFLVGADAGNYLLASSSVSGRVGAINAKSLLVTGVTAQAKVYDGTTTATIDTSAAMLSGVLAGEDVSLVTSGAVGSFVDKNVGTGQTVIVTGLSLSGVDEGNYDVSPPVGVTATITAADLAVTANPATKIYGGPVPSLTYIVSGLVGADTAGTALSGSLATTAMSGSHVGSYPITQGTLTAVNGNYTINFGGANVSVSPAPLSISANNVSKPYGAPVPPLTASYSGLVIGDTAASLSTPPTLTTSATATSPVGVYGIQVAGAGSLDYTFSYVPGTLTVAKAITSAALTGGSISIAVVGQTATYTVQLAPVSPGAGKPTGTVTLLMDGTPIGTVEVDPTTGQATLSTPPLVLGTHVVTASYSGDPNFQGSELASHQIVVSAAGTQSILTAQAVRNKRGRIVSVKLRSQVSVVAPGSGVPTGVVTYFRRGHFIRSVGLSNGGAVLTLKPNQALKKRFTIQYSGDLSFSRSASATVVVTRKSLGMSARPLAAFFNRG